jgi:hypothetical protein
VMLQRRARHTRPHLSYSTPPTRRAIFGAVFRAAAGAVTVGEPLLKAARRERRAARSIRLPIWMTYHVSNSPRYDTTNPRFITHSSRRRVHHWQSITQAHDATGIRELLCNRSTITYHVYL